MLVLFSINLVKGRTQSFVRGLRKGVSGKPYPHLCNAMRPRLEPETFRSQAVRLYRLHQARPSKIRGSIAWHIY